MAKSKKKTKSSKTVDWRKYRKETIYLAPETKNELRENYKAKTDDERLKKLMERAKDVRKVNSGKAEKQRSHDKTDSSRDKLGDYTGYLEIVV